MALCEAGFDAQTETVVVVRLRNRSAAFSHLIRTLEVHNISVKYSYAVSESEELYVILRTNDNPRAEDAIHNYLCLEDKSRS